QIESRYPYTEEGEIFWPLDAPWPDPWVTLGAMASVTQELGLATNIYLAALRDPFTAAKAAATAAVLSANRIVCGVSAGWIAEEYALVGIDFASRGRRLDEQIEVMRKLWTGREIEHHGEFFDIEHAILCPGPGGRRQSAGLAAGGASRWLVRHPEHSGADAALPADAPARARGSRPVLGGLRGLDLVGRTPDARKYGRARSDGRRQSVRDRTVGAVAVGLHIVVRREGRPGEARLQAIRDGALRRGSRPQVRLSPSQPRVPIPRWPNILTA
ncbi:MAG: LLM class flavin-dependent oxidoreductase, partial [Deltaproteobacteria bacterium]|nr:LLM class flavin-dependent oxidoreductase [Deltaproteobacteria bacterium]